MQQDMKVHYSDVIVNLLGLWEHPSNFELYFKERYKEFNYRIGKLKDISRFLAVKLILNDLYGSDSIEVGNQTTI